MTDLFTSAELDAALALAKAAYSAALEGGEEMQWEGRRIRLKSPSEYFQEIERLTRIKDQQTYSTRKGHNVSYAKVIGS